MRCSVASLRAPKAESSSSPRRMATSAPSATRSWRASTTYIPPATADASPGISAAANDLAGAVDHGDRKPDDAAERIQLACGVLDLARDFAGTIRNSAPASVTVMRRAVRSRSPSRASSSPTMRDTEGCDRPSSRGCARSWRSPRRARKPTIPAADDSFVFQNKCCPNFPYTPLPANEPDIAGQPITEFPMALQYRLYAFKADFIHPGKWLRQPTKELLDSMNRATAELIDLARPDAPRRPATSRRNSRCLIPRARRSPRATCSPGVRWSFRRLWRPAS